MNQQEQREAIAEAYGWQYLSDYCYEHASFMGSKAYGEGWKSPKTGKVYEEVPNYLKDLNAMHEVESSLNNNQKWDYLARLHEIMGTYHTAELVFATAAQRAEAFLKTIGKWKD